MEWLAIAVDAPLLMVAIFVYILVVLIGKRFSTEGLLYRIAAVGEQFYNNFVHLFQRKETILLGISGMLVLHLVTDIANFIVPLLIAAISAAFLTKAAFPQPFHSQQMCF